VLACGAEEKNTFCLTRDNHAFICQHIGDMENMETLAHYERTLDLYKKLFRIQPEFIAYDLHPEYLPTKFALERIERDGLKGIGVQHHHAHIASCLADNSHEGPVIGVAFDGTGYGADGRIWGGEFMIANDRDYKRVGQLEYMPLPGGSLAIRKPYRTALGYLLAMGGEPGWKNLPGFMNSIDTGEAELIRKQVVQEINSPFTSSMGRLFDAVSAMAGIRGVIDYEAQAAIELEMKALEAQDEPGCYQVVVDSAEGYHTVKLKALLTSVIDDITNNASQAVIAMKFHNTVARLTQDVCSRIRQESGLDTVALSGGCFQNRLLLIKVIVLLRKSGFKVLAHRQVPANDGGISLGQAVIAARSI
jgi:hydrogenase maturation protein HypF